jgi:hypothetical protein
MQTTAAPSRTTSATTGALPLRFCALAFASTWFFWERRPKATLAGNSSPATYGEG